MAVPGIPELAQQTLDFVQPYLLVLASKVPEGTATQAGKAIFDWLKSKLTTPAAVEVLKEAEAAPQEAANLKGLAVQIEKLCKDPAMAAELGGLLTAHGAVQSDTILGDGNKTAKAIGSNIRINIG